MKKSRSGFTFGLFFVFLPTFALANEWVLPREAFRAMSYVPYAAPSPLQTESFLEPPQGMDWPIQFQDKSHTIAQNYVNFQDYGDSPYYHGGCDLRTNGANTVKTPVSGILEGGYYGYVDNPDGSMEKQWQPWSGETHDDPYFELAILTQDGYRFEFHHIDSLHLPDSIVQSLNQGHVTLAAGAILGQVNAAAFPGYAHIHFNIIAPNGVRMNPEQYAKPEFAPDHVAPRIQAVYAVGAKGVATVVNSKQDAPSDTSQIVVDALESRDDDAYVQTPPYVRIHFENGSDFAWDFRKSLLGPDGKWPDLRNFIAYKLDLADGNTIDSAGQYGQGKFLIRLPVNAQDHGQFEITVGDTAGNQSLFKASKK